MSGAQYNAANEQIGWGAALHLFDLNGNLRDDGVKVYTWDDRNRLTAISGAVTASFEYDALGRRIRKTVTGTTTEYLYDGLDAVQELSAGGVAANLLTGLGVDDVLLRTDAVGSRHVLKDGLGSSIALADDAGALPTTLSYEPFGTTTVGGQPAPAVQFTGRDNDGTGLYYYRARYYETGRHRFVSEDPVGLGGGDVNVYAYVRNVPTRYTDASGLWIDTVVDIFSIGYDIYQLAIYGRKNLPVWGRLHEQRGRSITSRTKISTCARSTPRAASSPEKSSSASLTEHHSIMSPKSRKRRRVCLS
jgi:RHS repeat-associated protein